MAWNIQQLPPVALLQCSYVWQISMKSSPVVFTVYDLWHFQSWPVEFGFKHCMTSFPAVQLSSTEV